ncbi:DgyrCDS446 [Dimorphilus gyrociliatus]|uniref:DgyrCDS446 n=1 Tax=Dimorphilus gyrociliatus TaxID=2664684 RepID=A0A7I8V751_9ANNE|nr:DgyrCDS446 [Dimorphilus gyrociliatus]
MGNLKKPSDKVPKDPTVWMTFQKAMAVNSPWPDKEEFLDVVYWMRQIIGIIIGVICGSIPMTGFLAMIIFAALEAIVIQVYTTSYQSVDVDDLGGISEVLKEGFMTAFASFLVTWIIFYSAIHS